MDVLVTGGAGFLGGHVCRILRSRPGVGRIFVLDDLSTGRAENLAGIADLELVVGTILDRGLVDRLAGATRSIVHLAAIPAVARSLENPMASHSANASGTVVVLEAARQARSHVIVASSSSVYGGGARLPASEDQPTRPASPYAASKLATEAYALAYRRSFGLEVLVLRLFNVYGPGQRADHAYAAVVPAFVSAACAGRPLVVHGDGGQTRDFTFVTDTAHVISEAVGRIVTADGPVNLAFGGRSSVLTLVDELERVMGRPLPRRHVPTRPGDVRDSQADPTRLRALFPGLVPATLAEGLAATVAWFGGLQSMPTELSPPISVAFTPS